MESVFLDLLGSKEIVDRSIVRAVTKPVTEVSSASYRLNKYCIAATYILMCDRRFRLADPTNPTTRCSIMI